MSKWCCTCIVSNKFFTCEIVSKRYVVEWLLWTNRDVLNSKDFCDKYDYLNSRFDTFHSPNVIESYVFYEENIQSYFFDILLKNFKRNAQFLLVYMFCEILHFSQGIIATIIKLYKDLKSWEREKISH